MKNYIVYDKVTHQKLREGTCPHSGFTSQVIYENEAVVESSKCTQVTLVEPWSEERVE